MNNNNNNNNIIDLVKSRPHPLAKLIDSSKQYSLAELLELIKTNPELELMQFLASYTLINKKLNAILVQIDITMTNYGKLWFTLKLINKPMKK